MIVSLLRTSLISRPIIYKTLMRFPSMLISNIQSGEKNDANIRPKLSEESKNVIQNKNPINRYKSSQTDPYALLSYSPTEAELASKKRDVIISALGSEEYRTKVNPKILLLILNALKKKIVLMKGWKPPKEIIETLKFISTDDKVKIFNANELITYINIVKYYSMENYKVLTMVTNNVFERRDQLSLKDLINILIAMKKSYPIVAQRSMYRLKKEIMKNIRIKIEEEKSDLIVLSKIIELYSFEEYDSPEFYKVIRDKMLANFDSSQLDYFADGFLNLSKSKKSCGGSCILYKEKIVEILTNSKITKKNFQDNVISAKIFVKLVRGLFNKKLLDEQILQTIEDQLLKWKNNFFTSDICSLYFILANSRKIYNPEKAFELINNYIKDNLYDINFFGGFKLVSTFQSDDCPLDAESIAKVKQQLILLLKTNTKVDNDVLLSLYNLVKDNPNDPLSKTVKPMLKHD